jgi:hypothetical protein
LDDRLAPDSDQRVSASLEPISLGAMFFIYDRIAFYKNDEYFLLLLVSYGVRASEGTLSCWSRLHLQSLASTPVSRRVDVRLAAGRKNSCQIFITA